MEDGLIKVISPIDDTPAAKAGLKTGDFIAAIDGKSIQGMALNDAIDKMRGAAGTKVTLTILRTGDKKPFDVTLVRAPVQVDNVKWHREARHWLYPDTAASTSRPTTAWSKPCASSRSRSVRRSRAM